MVDAINAYDAGSVDVTSSGVKVLMEMLSNPAHSIEASVTSSYPILAYPYGPGLQQVVNLNGFYEGNWPPEFRAIVDKIKS